MIRKALHTKRLKHRRTTGVWRFAPTLAALLSVRGLAHGPLLPALAQAMLQHSCRSGSKELRVQLTVLVDNNTFVDQYYLGEPAFSLHLQDGARNILFDTGYSDVYLRNAQVLGLDLVAVDVIAISHGHDDHTRGLAFWLEAALPSCRLVAHPHTFLPKRSNGLNVGSPLGPEELARSFTFEGVRTPLQLSEHVIYLGEIPCVHEFERPRALGTVFEGGAERDDLLTEDTALVYNGPNGLFIMTGCSHCGICNIIGYAQKVCGQQRIAGVLGGFHLLELSPRLDKTIEYFKRVGIGSLYPCHCVSFAAKSAIHQRIPLAAEVGVGLRLTIE